MSDIRDILELEQGSPSMPSKESIVGANKVSFVCLIGLQKANLDSAKSIVKLL